MKKVIVLMGLWIISITLWMVFDHFENNQYNSIIDAEVRMLDASWLCYETDQYLEGIITLDVFANTYMIWKELEIGRHLCKSNEHRRWD